MDNNQIDNNDVAFAPSVDAIQEFNLISQNAPASYGNYLGGIVSVTLKSGTNQFHGDVFEFIRNDALNANTWAAGLNKGISPYIPGVQPTATAPPQASPSLERIWRLCRWSYHQGQAVLLRRLPGLTLRPARNHEVLHRRYRCRADGRLLRRLHRRFQPPGNMQ